MDMLQGVDIQDVGVGIMGCNLGSGGHREGIRVGSIVQIITL